jgi:hypothetical protein
METTTRCLLLKNDQVLISEIEEVQAELGDPNCKLINPFILDRTTNELHVWLNFTDQNEIMLRSEDILTMVEPSPDILKKYESIKY